MDIIDLHCDTLYRAVTEALPLDDEAMEVRLNAAPDAHKLQCYAIWLPDALSGEEAEQLFFRAHRRLQTECAACGVYLLHGGEGVSDAFHSHANTAFFTVENGLALNGKTENVQRFADCGVRMMTLTWNAANSIGDGADVAHTAGLTAFGRNVLAEMERHHIIVDISHASEKLFDDVAATARRPFVASHSNAFAVTPHRRNLTDRQFDVIRKNGGLVGVNFHNAFLNRCPEKASREDIIRHIEHFLSLGGEDTVCFGSDFDGGTLPHDFTNSAVYDKIYEGLCRRNYQEALIRKIFYENALNFFENFDNC